MGETTFTVERLVPNEMLAGGRYQTVARAIAHPPNTHTGPIRRNLVAVEVVTIDGSRRWFGTDRAWIGSDLRMHIMVNPRDEVRSSWEKPRA